jgi:hypothetical protein
MIDERIRIRRGVFMKKLTVLSVVALLGLAGCSNEALTGPDGGGAADAQVAKSASAVHAPMQVPIKWTFEVEPLQAGVLECMPAGSGFYVPANYSVSGHVSHLGKVDSDASLATFTGCTLTPGGASGELGIALVGANGDAIHLDGVLTLSLADGVGYGTYTITGGTGRFEGATGWMQTTETPTPDGSGSAGGGWGMITPPGALH